MTNKDNLDIQKQTSSDDEKRRLKEIKEMVMQRIDSIKERVRDDSAARISTSSFVPYFFMTQRRKRKLSLDETGEQDDYFCFLEELKDKLRQAEEIQIMSDTEDELVIAVRFPFYIFGRSKNSYGDYTDRYAPSLNNKVKIMVRAARQVYSWHRDPPKLYVEPLDIAQESDRKAALIPNKEVVTNIAKSTASGDEIDKLLEPLRWYSTSGHERLYDDFIARYVDLLQKEQTLTVKVESCLTLVRRTERANEDDLLKDHILSITHDEAVVGQLKVRKFASEHREMTIKELRQELKELQAAAMDMDRERYNLHRMIERFAFLFFCGCSKLEVVADIQRIYDEISGKTWPLIDQIYCSVKELKYTITTEFEGLSVYRIAFGIGETSTSGSHGYYDEEIGATRGETGASEPEYESFIAKGNNSDDDHKIIDATVDEVSSIYPRVRMENKLGVRGSFHEQFQGMTLEIDYASVLREAESRGQSRDEVLSGILAIIKKHILAARE